MLIIVTITWLQIVTYPNTKPYSHSEHSVVVACDIHRRYPCEEGKNSKDNLAKGQHLQQFHPPHHHTNKAEWDIAIPDYVVLLRYSQPRSTEGLIMIRVTNISSEWMSHCSLGPACHGVTGGGTRLCNLRIVFDSLWSESGCNRF